MVGFGISVIVITILFVAVPPGPTALKVKVVVLLGETILVPERGTEPIFGEIVRLVAFETRQLKVEDLPLIIEAGEADAVMIGSGGGGSVTVIVTLTSLVPPGPTALKVKVVVLLGETILVPERGTEPIFGEIVRLVAFETRQLKVEDLPLIIEAGEADAVMIGSGGGGSVTVIVTLTSLVPPGPIAVNV
ncbi:MAG: hypothetical protein DDT22_01355 [candidate division WS2 bacterium]|nr:hypothetical protein [Candidatus Lithacetigena glycinireducens]